MKSEMMNTELEQIIAEMNRKLGINQMDLKDFTVVDIVSNSKDFAPSPWCMAFAYTPDGNYLFRGWSVPVRDYIRSHIPKAMVNFVHFKDKRMFHSWNLYIPGKHILTINPGLKTNARKNRGRHFVFQEIGRRPYLKLRRIPKKWIPEFEPK